MMQDTDRKPIPPRGGAHDDGRLARQIIAVLVSLVFVFSIYYGSYLPWKKSGAFIATLQRMESMKSVAELQTAFAEPFSIPSPIGQEELVRHFNTIILNTVQRVGKDQPQAATELVAFAEKSFEPIIARGRGMSFGQNLFILGSLNHTLFATTKNPQFLQKAQQYFEYGYELSPKRPQFIYSLFTIYEIIGDVEKVTALRNQIKSQWPADTAADKSYEEFMKQMAKQGKAPAATSR